MRSLNKLLLLLLILSWHALWLVTVVHLLLWLLLDKAKWIQVVGIVDVIAKEIVIH